LPTVEEAEGIWDGIWQEEAHHSTAMEGNTLGKKEVQLLLFEGKAVGAKEFVAYLEVQGYAQAAKWVYGQAVKERGTGKAVTLTELRQIHERVVEPVWRWFPPDHLDERDRPGDWRHTNLEALRPGLTPPDWTQVPSLISDWVDRANESLEGGAAAARIIEDFAAVHAEFERVHPFNDGNGRVGRLVLNLLLVRFGYPPAVIHKQHRSTYLDGLKRADERDNGLLGEVLAAPRVDPLQVPHTKVGVLGGGSPSARSEGVRPAPGSLGQI
jgi:Fic family protein